MKHKYNTPDIEILSVRLNKDVLAVSDEVIATEGYIEPRPNPDDF